MPSVLTCNPYICTLGICTEKGISPQLVSRRECSCRAYNERMPVSWGACENSAEFRRSAADAWKALDKGGSPAAESGYSVGADGGTFNLHTEIHPPTSGIAELQHGRISYQPDDFGISHTYPNTSSDRPSANDIAAAEKIKRNVWLLRGRAHGTRIQTEK
jgi:hypothetical protein